MIKSIHDLKVYKQSHHSAMKVFKIASVFPKSENFSLTDQIIRSSRSISANIREGFAKKKYKNIFIKHLIDALGSSEETREWLLFAYECGYIDKETLLETDKKYDEINAMLSSLINKWQDFH